MSGAVAVFLPNWVGDAVMATPAVRAARRHYAGRRVVAVGRPAVLDTVAGSPWFDAVVPADRGGPLTASFWRTVGALRRERADVAVLFPNSLRVAAAARAAGCRTVAGFARYFRDTLLTHRVYPVRGRDGRPKPTPAVDSYNRVVRKLGVADPGHRLELFTAAADEAAAAAAWADLRLDRFRRVVGLNPGGAFGAAKHWPAGHFADLARGLADRGLGVVVTCGPAERDVAREIARKARRDGVVSLAGVPPSVGLTKAVVRRLTALVTTDSGPRHFAAAFGVPVVTLFGPTHAEWTETYFPHAAHLQRKLGCGPCQRRACPLGHHRCMTDLSPAAVLAATSDLLALTERRHAG